MTVLQQVKKESEKMPWVYPKADQDPGNILAVDLTSKLPHESGVQIVESQNS